MFRAIFAIFWRDLLSATSYRLGFVLQFVAPLFMIISFFFLSKLLGQARLPGLDRYGGDYFSFALVGMVFATYTGIFLSAVVTTIRQGQANGTLEIILTTRTSLATYLVGSSLYALLQSAILLTVFIALGVGVLGARFPGGNFLVGGLILLLSMAVMLGLGIISGSIVLVYKQGDPLSLVVNSGAFLLSGVVYPISVLPGWLQSGSWLLPHTYALESLRLTLLQGASLAQVAWPLSILALFAAGLLPLGWLLFRRAVRRARTEGSFAYY